MSTFGFITYAFQKLPHILLRAKRIYTIETLVRELIIKAFQLQRTGLLFIYTVMFFQYILTKNSFSLDNCVHYSKRE